MSRLSSKQEDINKWYEELILQSNFASHWLVKGTVLLHPKSYFVWEKIQKFVNREFEKHNIKNVLFPTLIPVSELEKEKKQLEGFAPELFLINKNNSDDSNSLFLRPTSEILFSHYFREQCAKTYKNLPILINQWCNVFRMEKNTKIFFRGCEFSWQEVHSVHLTVEEAKNYCNVFFQIYKNLVSNFLNMGMLCGEKTVNERFAGASNTLTVEVVMPDGQFVQVATSHFLGQTFSKAYDISYMDENNKKCHPIQLSAGCSTRLLGALLMSHSDDSGLVMPWDCTDIKIKILVLNNAVKKDDIVYKKINQQILKYKYEWDFSEKSFGHKIMDEELNGTPIVLVIGKKELEENKVMMKSRVKPNKTFINFDNLSESINQEKKEFNSTLKKKNQNFLNSLIVKCKNFEEVKQAISDKKIALAPWFDNEENEKKFKEQKLGFGPRCIKQSLLNKNKKCFFSGKIANSLVYFGRSY